MNYYNEFDPKAASWLRQLIADKQIPEGFVDDRSITEVKPSDLQDFVQCHFFAGIGGWSRALDLAGWPSNRPVWTASLPCQPFSSAGKQAGTDDERHLWPVFQRLVSECRPPVLLGEQVSSKIAREKWFPGVCLDLQAMGYPVTALDLCAPCAGEDGEGRTHRGDIEQIIIGAPHIRQRLYWVAYRGESGRLGNSELHGCATDQIGRSPCESQEQGRVQQPEGSSSDHRMAQPRNVGAGSQPRQACGLGGQPVDTGTAGLRQDHGTACTGGADPRGAGCDTPDRMADTPSNRRERAWQGAEAEEGRQPRPELGGELPCGSEGRGLHSGTAHTVSEGCKGGIGFGQTGTEGESRRHAVQCSYSDFTLIPCRDGKARRVESGVKPLVAGLPRGVVPSCDPGAPGYANETAEARVMRLKGYGNAIVPPLAAEFILAFMEVTDL